MISQDGESHPTPATPITVPPTAPEAARLPIEPDEAVENAFVGDVADDAGLLDEPLVGDVAEVVAEAEPERSGPLYLGEPDCGAAVPAAFAGETPAPQKLKSFDLTQSVVGMGESAVSQADAPTAADLIVQPLPLPDPPEPVVASAAVAETPTIAPIASYQGHFFYERPEAPESLGHVESTPIAVTKAEEAEEALDESFDVEVDEADPVAIGPDVVSESSVVHRNSEPLPNRVPQVAVLRDLCASETVTQVSGVPANCVPQTLDCDEFLAVTEELQDDEEAELVGAGLSGSGWTIPLLCIGIAVIACCMFLPQVDANRRLVYERANLRADLESIQAQVATNDEFLRKLAGDPTLAERLAQRQMKMMRAGTKALPMVGSDQGMSPFELVQVAAPRRPGPYSPTKGVLAELCANPRKRLYLMGGGLFLMAAGLVLGSSPRRRD